MQPSGATTPAAAAPVLFLTVQRFCQERSLPRSTFYQQVKAGKIRPVKRGRRTLIRLAEAERYDDSLPAIDREHVDAA